MASNTGWRFEGDDAITFSTSAVAVCRASASFVSLKSRAFSMAMTACVAKDWSNVDWLSANAPGSVL
jgi:hypothetical protein